MIPLGPTVTGSTLSNKAPITLTDSDLPLHYNIRSFRANLKPIYLTLADLSYHSNKYWESAPSVSDLSVRDITDIANESWTTYGLVQDDLDLLTQDDLDLLNQFQIEGTAGIGLQADWDYAPGMSINIPTTGRLITSTFDHDNLLQPPFDESGTYYIELILRDWAASTSSPRIDLANSYITFSSSNLNDPAVTDKFFFNQSLTDLTTAGQKVFKINRDSITHANLSNIQRVDLYLVAIGGTFVFKAESLRLVKSDYTFPYVGIDTKSGILAYNPSEHGSKVDTQPDPIPILNTGSNKGLNLSEILKFNSGHHPTNPNYNSITMYLRGDNEGAGEYIEVEMRSNDTELAFLVYEGGTGKRMMSTIPLDESTDYFLQIILNGTNLQIVVWKASANYPTDVVFNSANDQTITVSRNVPGWVAIDMVPYNADFTVDYMFARDADIGTFTSKVFQTQTAIDAASLYADYSPPIQLLTDSIKEGEAFNIFHYPYNDSGSNNGDFVIEPGVNDVTVSLDTLMTNNSNSSYKVRKQIRNAFLAGVEWENFIKINDPLNATIRGSIRFDEKLSFGEFRIVFFDKNLENISFVSIIPIDQMVLNKWNDFEIPVLNEKIYNNEFRIQFHHLGIDESVDPDDEDAVGTFWLSNFRIETETVIWEAANTDELNYMRFFDTIGSQYQGVHFPERGTKLRLRARAFSKDAWISGYEIIPHYAEPGRIVE